MKPFSKTYADDWQALEAEWSLFVREIDHAYDFERAAVQYQEGKPLRGLDAGTSIAVYRGWQSSGIFFRRGRPTKLGQGDDLPCRAIRRMRRGPVIQVALLYIIYPVIPLELSRQFSYPRKKRIWIF